MVTELVVAGERVASIDALGRRTEFTYDEFGRLTETQFPKADDEPGTPAHTFKRTTYDKLGRAVAETDQANNATSFVYDTLGRLQSVTDAMSHTWTYGYDAAGAQTSQTDPNNHTTTFDELGRQVTSYDAVMTASTTITTKYDLAGQRLSVTDYLGVTSYRYDPRGRLIQETKFSGEALSYGYDANGNQTLSAVYAQANLTGPIMQTLKTYDELNRLKTVTGAEGTYSYDYNDVGARKSESNPNGTRTDYSYDALNRLKGIKTVQERPLPADDIVLRRTWAGGASFRAASTLRGSFDAG